MWVCERDRMVGVGDFESVEVSGCVGVFMGVCVWAGLSMKGV